MINICSFALTKFLVYLSFKMSLAASEGKTEKTHSRSNVFDLVLF